MPYRDPERKREWERQHREERNAAKRRARTRLAERSAQAEPTAAHTGSSLNQRQTSGWKVALGFVIGAAIVALAAVAGINPQSGGGSSAASQ